ncbi:hypothetical protein GCM10022276_21000 [Sphingomonas limnosediminicola]|jgi:hypothetical protein|uniref:Uncharacterized protein n=1 Tax=Sphingomonas limnosediminicola TaxID=940133 RepID=A0ABP7LLU7_9SPHN
MKIEGSVRSNLLAAIASSRRLRGQRVHRDTLKHWQQIAEHAGRVSMHGEAVTDLVAELNAELAHAVAA